MDLGLLGAAAVINGGSKGMGRAAAEVMAAEGAELDDSDGMKGYLESLPPERRIDPSDLHAVMRIIDEDYGHPAHLGRAALPAEIGPVIAFVGSLANTYMTGADINVDGGSDF